jgi:Leucine Rich repeat
MYPITSYVREILEPSRTSKPPTHSCLISERCPRCWQHLTANTDMNSNASIPDHPRRRLRFGLRSILVAVFVIACGLGWVAARFREARRQHHAALAVVALHGTVDYGRHFRLESWGRVQLQRPVNYTWLRKQFGDELFDRVTTVAFFRRLEVTDTDMALLDYFPDLEDFHVSKAPVTSLSPLARLMKLRRVTLSEVPISDDGLAAISRLPLLTDVSVNGTRIGDEGLATLGKMRQLRLLNLEWTKVTDAGMAELAGLEWLEWLNLSCTEITDAGLDHLRELKGLKFLMIAGTRVTPQGKNSIEASLPGCNVTWWAREGDLSQAGGRPEIPDPNPASIK